MNDPMFDWQDRAACRNLPVETFYFEQNQGTADREVKRVCQSCPVRVSCAVFGLAEDHGYWGGASPDTRKEWRKQLAMSKWMRTNGNENRYARYLPWLQKVFLDARRMGVKSSLLCNTPHRERTLAWLRSLEPA